MALFKILRGNATNLSSVAKKDGYAYFCTDTHDFYIDYTKADGTLERAQLNAYAADKLTTGRTIGLGTAVSSTATTFDGSKNITIPVTEIKEAYLTWGGKNLTGLVGPLGASLSAEHSANRLAYFPPAGIKFEHSVDGGATWEEKSTYGDAYKTRFVTLSTSVPVTLNAPVSTSQMMRCTITSQDGTISGSGRVYTRARKMLIDVNTPHQLQVKIERKKGSSSSWGTVGTYTISGQTAWNEIPLDAFPFGGTSSQTGNYWQIRLTFSILTANTSYANTKPSIQGIRLFGDTMWATPSALAKTGHLYTYDEAQQATFPASIIQNSSAHKIYSKGSLKADGATTLGGTLNVTGKTTLKETATGALTASSLSSTGALSVTGNSTLTGSLTVKGNTTLGDAATDTVTIKGPITSEGRLTTKFLTVSHSSVFGSDLNVHKMDIDSKVVIGTDLSETRTALLLDVYGAINSNELSVCGGAGIDGDIDVGGVLYVNGVNGGVNSIEAVGGIYSQDNLSTGGMLYVGNEANLNIVNVTGVLSSTNEIYTTNSVIYALSSDNTHGAILDATGYVYATDYMEAPEFIGDLTGTADEAYSLTWAYFDDTGTIS